MAGHSHSANIKHRKGAVDAKRAKIFSKLARNIASAVRQGGPDLDTNLRIVEQDLQATDRGSAYGSGARPRGGDAAQGEPDFSKMSAAEKVQWNLDRMNRIFDR